MIRLRTSQVELTPSDVAYNARRVVLQRRAARAAESANTLARQNARIEGILAQSPDEHPLLLLPGRQSSHARDESIISEEPVVYGHREFWDKVVAEAGPIDNADVESGDEEAISTSHTQDDGSLVDRSSVLPYELHGEDSTQQDANCEATEEDGDSGSLRAGQDDIPLQTGAHAPHRRVHEGQYDGACDVASGGSEFCSPSISVSSINWPHGDAEGRGASEEDGESYPSSSEFEEDVTSGPELSPHVSPLDGPELSQHLSIEEEANLLTLRRSFSAQLNFDGATESPQDNSSPPQPPFLFLPSVRISDSPLSAHSARSAGQTHRHGSPHLSPRRAPPRSASRSREAIMGLPMWNGSDYEDQSLRYTLRTGYTFSPTTAQRLLERRLANVRDAAPMLSDEETIEDDDSQSMAATVDITVHESAVISAGGSVQLPVVNSVFSVQGDEIIAHHGPDRSPIRYPQVHISPVMVAPPPSPSQGFITPRLTVFNDSQVNTAADRHHPRRRPLRPNQHIPRLVRSTHVLGHGELELEETPRQRRGRELGLPEHWIHDNVIAQREFHQWVNMSDIPGLDRGDSSEEL
ncbi:MAG: hypothetical protein M1840_006376 [Geoglossum simile]|nr:MAG: hypothetical protein M1840_006376 [Geoglossum simile]